MKSPVEGWTDGRFQGFVVSTLRAGMRRFPNKWQALSSSHCGSILNKKTNRVAKAYECASCHNLFQSKEVEVDHIMPVINPLKGFITWDDYIERLFCPLSNLQTLCKKCHKAKTAAERLLKKNGKPLQKRVTTTASKRSKSSSKAPGGAAGSGKTLTRKRKPSSVAT